MNKLNKAALAVTLLALAGCGAMGVESKRVDYRAKAASAPSLEVPPDLTVPSGEARYTVPGVDGETVASYSEFAQENGASASGAAPRSPLAQNVLPQPKSVHLERDGNKRWLRVEDKAEAVWPQLKSFWMENGFTLTVENPQAGLMETDWLENRAKISQGGLRSVIGKVLDGLYTSPQRDQYRTRIERSADGSQTEIHLTHYGKEEIVDDSAHTSQWRSLPNDPEIEASMLQLLMVKLGGVAATPEQPAATAGSLAAPAAAGAVRISGDVIVIGEPFDKSWRRVGLALERSGLIVEDKDRAGGVFEVRSGQAQPQEESWLDRLKFWRTDPSEVRYRVSVREVGSNCEVRVADREGDNEEQSRKLMAVLYQQLGKQP